MKDILVVEDGVKERERLRNLFTKEGYKVSACESVGEAEEELKTQNFRLAILDIGLSDKSGSYLFNSIKRLNKVTYIIIFTGNPSVHLKQRFIEEGATDYIVKASAEAQNDRFLSRVKEIIGAPEKQEIEGIDLNTFISKYLADSSRNLFFEEGDKFPACKKCGSKEYRVVFNNKTQMPPEVVGQVVCVDCNNLMDPDIG